MLVALSGRKRSGKDTTAALLVKEAGFTQMSFAGKLKELTAALLDAPVEYVQSDDFKSRCILSCENGEDIFCASSGRVLLQRLGAAARKTFGEQFWVEQVLEHVVGDHEFEAPAGEVGCRKMTEEGTCAAGRECHDVVISDVRYWSELWAVKRAGGLIVRLNRYDRECAHEYMRCGDMAGCDWCYPLVGSPDRCGLPIDSHPTHWTGDTHPSETELPDDGSFYDFVCTQPSAERSAQAVLAWVKGRMT
jgi:hypothetical protein